MATRKKGSSGGKLSRSEVVTVRLDPRLRFGVELAARKHRRTASSFIEWAVEQALKQMIMQEDKETNMYMTAEDVLNRVWDVDEPDRFARLAIYFPDLLTHEDQLLWKLIKECGFIWRGHYETRGDKEVWTWVPREKSLDFEKLREHWDLFNQVAHGEVSQDKLPTWVKEKPSHFDDTPF